MWGGGEWERESDRNSDVKNELERQTVRTITEINRQWGKWEREFGKLMRDRQWENEWVTDSGKMNERQTVGKMNERGRQCEKWETEWGKWERGERNYKEYKMAREREKFLDDVMRIDKIWVAGSRICMELGRNIIKSRHPPSPPKKKSPSQKLLWKSLSNLTLETLT